MITVVTNSGVTLIASTTSFASSKDKNPIAADFTYYGRIVDIVELIYYNHFKVVLFKCDWYEVEKDVYGLNYVTLTRDALRKSLLCLHLKYTNASMCKIHMIKINIML